MRTDIAKKEAAIKLRKKGKSIRDIENILGVARSTLSGWLRDVKLSEKHKKQLHERWLAALGQARVKAAEVHKAERMERIAQVKKEAEEFVSRLKLNRKLGEVIFSIFYLAEGTKTEGSVRIANSDPVVLLAFVKLIRYLYPIDETKFRCCLHLRADQKETQFKKYWSEILNIPPQQFIKTQFDKRTTESSYKDYKGVCVVIYFDTGLQRRIIHIGRSIISKLVNET